MHCLARPFRTLASPLTALTAEEIKRLRSANKRGQKKTGWKEQCRTTSAKRLGENDWNDIGDCVTTSPITRTRAHHAYRYSHHAPSYTDLQMSPPSVFCMFSLNHSLLNIFSPWYSGPPSRFSLGGIHIITPGKLFSCTVTIRYLTVPSKPFILYFFHHLYYPFQ